jgi:E3 ubiquitin-protein ligase DOA10
MEDNSPPIAAGAEIAATSSLWSNTEEDDCCRVCHGEAEEFKPLFHPCRCSGSIKFVHQDCLQMWLKVSKQSHPKCELCGEFFNFRNIYKSGMEGIPPKLTIMEFTYGLYSIAAEAIYVLGQALLACILWVYIYVYRHINILFQICICIYMYIHLNMHIKSLYIHTLYIQ